MKRRLYSLVLFNLVASAGAVGDITSFLSQSKPIKLSAFMDLVTLPSHDRQEYQAFYRNEIDRMRNMHSNKKSAKLKSFEQQGINSLEIKHPRWARELSLVLKKGNALYNNAHTFVVRYAALELYHEHKARQKNNIWAKVQNFFSQTKETVAGWASSLRPKRKVV